MQYFFQVKVLPFPKKKLSSIFIKKRWGVLSRFFFWKDTFFLLLSLLHTNIITTFFFLLVSFFTFLLRGRSNDLARSSFNVVKYQLAYLTWVAVTYSYIHPSIYIFKTNHTTKVSLSISDIEKASLIQPSSKCLCLW